MNRKTQLQIQRLGLEIGYPLSTYGLPVIDHAIAHIGRLRNKIATMQSEIDRLRSENAALTVERDHARQDAAAVRLQLAEKQRPFTVTVEIPERDGDGECSGSCPLWNYQLDCVLNLHNSVYPGPGCPRYQKQEADKSNG